MPRTSTGLAEPCENELLNDSDCMVIRRCAADRDRLLRWLAVIVARTIHDSRCHRKELDNYATQTNL